MIKLYTAFMLPHLEYSSPLFVGIGTGQRNSLEDGNCYILRALIGLNKSMSYDELLATASMTSLYIRRLHQALTLLLRCLNGTGPTYIGILFKYSGTPLYGHPLNADTRFIRTVSFVPTKSSCFFSKINPLYTDTG